MIDLVAIHDIALSSQHHVDFAKLIFLQIVIIAIGWQDGVTACCDNCYWMEGGNNNLL